MTWAWYPAPRAVYFMDARDLERAGEWIEAHCDHRRAVLPVPHEDAYVAAEIADFKNVFWFLCVAAGRGWQALSSSGGPTTLVRPVPTLVLEDAFGAEVDLLRQERRQQRISGRLFGIYLKPMVAVEIVFDTARNKARFETAFDVSEVP